MCGPKGASSYWRRLQQLNAPLMAYMFIQLNSIVVCGPHVVLQLAAILIDVMLRLSCPSQHSEQEVETILDKTIMLFRFLQDKVGSRLVLKLPL